MIFILLAVGLAGFILLPKSEASVEATQNSISTIIGNLPDTNPTDQAGNFSREFDDAFWQASRKWGVPFALLKAHARQESNFKKTAIRNEPATSNRPPSASYGLMQLLWWSGSDRFKLFGWSADRIGDGSILYDEYVNTDIAAQLIRDNFRVFKSLRDAINAYNTGTKESVRAAPGNYVDRVIGFYEDLTDTEINA